MRRLLILSLLASGSLALPAVAPASAQIAMDRIIDVYGDEKCPSSNGQDIVVCRHHPIEDKYRIPKDLRDEGPPTGRGVGGNSSAVSAVNTTGQTGVQVNSCNNIGAGVSVGCTKQGLDAWKAQQNAQKKAEEGVP